MDNNRNELVDAILTSPNLRSAVENMVQQTVSQRNISSSAMRTSNNSPAIRPSSNSLAVPSTSNSPVTPSSYSAIQEIRRLFPSMRTEQSTHFSGRNRKRRRDKEANLKFSTNIILLRSTSDKKTLLGKKKADAYEKDFAKPSIQIERNWSAQELKMFLKELFYIQLGESDFEICVPIGGYLVKPKLTDNQELDGNTLFKIFYRKDVYLRPTNELDVENNEYLREPIEVQDNFGTYCNKLTCESDERFDSVEEINIENKNKIDIIPLNLQCQDFKECDELLESEPKSLHEIVEKIRDKIDQEKINKFNIYRDEIFQCCLRALRRKSFSPYNKISVCFTDCNGESEGAVDMGGPLREMFRLVLNKIRSSRIFMGPEEAKFLILNKDALDDREYFEVGRLIVLSIVHAGLAPKFFSEFLFRQVVGDGESLEPNINNIMDDEIRKEINLANNTQDLDTLRSVIIEGTYIRLSGWELVNDFSKKKNMINDVINFYTAERNTKCLTQLVEGLKIMDFHKHMQNFPEYFIEVMCRDNTQVLDVNTFESLFEIRFNEEGSNKRYIENRIIAFWKDYLEECNETEEFKSDKVTLGDLLTFCTGSNVVPIFGFSTAITIDFLHEDCCPYPKANTCGLLLHLPAVHNKYEDFASNMTFGIKNGTTFAFA